MKPSEWIRKCEWCQGKEVDAQGRICVGEAIRRAYIDWLDDFTVHPKWIEISNKLGIEPKNLARVWNDQIIHEQEEAIRALEAIGE